ncbi:MAG: hypothetical protein M3R45_16270 [Pseudomonadota bacterium]|nr:hypothetical protein [Pseudomonadota bacterium]
MKRRSRWHLAATVAVALGSSLLSQPYLTSLASSPSSAPYQALGVTVAVAPPINTSWHEMLMSGR